LEEKDQNTTNPLFLLFSFVIVDRSTNLD
jgi:hypothetical protein